MNRYYVMGVAIGMKTELQGCEQPQCMGKACPFCHCSVAMWKFELLVVMDRATN